MNRSRYGIVFALTSLTVTAPCLALFVFIVRGDRAALTAPLIYCGILPTAVAFVTAFFLGPRFFKGSLSLSACKMRGGSLMCIAFVFWLLSGCVASSFQSAGEGKAIASGGSEFFEYILLLPALLIVFAIGVGAGSAVHSKLTHTA